MGDDYGFFSNYLDYTRETEAPVFFHRWAALSGLGAFLGRDFYFSHGHFQIHTNMYCMLMGSPGTRKSTAIKMMKSLLMSSGYKTIAADKTTKEKFMLDLSGDVTDAPYDPKATDNILESSLWGEDDSTSRPPAEMFVMADEFNDFFGNGNIEFISLLGTLWDYSGVYRSRVKNGKSIEINNPTVSILGGNTPTGFSLAFPAEILGQGFFSRILLIYGEPTGKRITFPKPPDRAHTELLIEELHRIKSTCIGAATMSPTAELLLDKIYKSWSSLDDPRFESYSNRRFTHLLKLCLLSAASRCTKTVSEQDVVHANTILSYTEHLMPKAMGEFGKARNSDVAHKIISMLEKAEAPMEFNHIWKVVISDLDKMSHLVDLLANLQTAKKVQRVGNAFLAIKAVRKIVDKSVYDSSILTPEERGE